MGSLEVICGCMFSGKTEELLRRARRHVIAKRDVRLYKSSVDNRYDRTSIISHNGIQIAAKPVENIWELSKSLDITENMVICLDEVQFMSSAVTPLVCADWANKGAIVIACGTDTDFRGNPFGPMPELMALADYVDKLHAVCVICGGNAIRNQRLINGKPATSDSPTILVGGSESYEARCRKCFEEPVKSIS